MCAVYAEIVKREEFCGEMAMALPDLHFQSLADLHDAVNEALKTRMRMTAAGRRRLARAHHVSEASLKMADSCAAAKDLVLLAKAHLQDLRSTFRHQASADGSGSFAPHRLPRKQLKKAILKRMQSLKGMKSTFAEADLDEDEEKEDQSLATVVNLLQQVRSTTVSIVDSLLPLIAMPCPDPSRSGRDPVFRIKLTRVDSLSFWERCSAADVRSVMKRLEEVEAVVDEMEGELEGMFRRLIRTRASLLNLLTV